VDEEWCIQARFLSELWDSDVEEQEDGLGAKAEVFGDGRYGKIIVFSSLVRETVRSYVFGTSQQLTETNVTYMVLRHWIV
jgi:hypothetical protein